MEEKIANFTQNLKYIGASPDDFFTISFWKSSDSPITCMCRKNDFDINKIVYASTITEFIYTFDTFERAVTKYSKIDLTHNISSGIFDGSRSKPMPMNKRFKSLFDKQGAESDAAMLLHFELDSPIIVIDYDLLYTYVKKISVYKNTKLRDIEFYKVVNTFRAFQDLSMFIGGVMGGKSPVMVEVSDKDRIAKHGFDKFSFRKEKQE
jgi:hypothetical protein